MTISYALIAEYAIKSTSDEIYSTQVISETSCQKTLRRVIEQKIIPKMMNHSVRVFSSYDKLILTHEMFTFFIKKERSSTGDVFYVVISTQDQVKHRVCWKMIDAMSQSYHDYVQSNRKNMINLTPLMKFHNDPNNDKITKLQHEVDEVKNVMMINVDKILENHKKMHELIAESDELMRQGELFVKGGKKLKWAMIKRWIYMAGAAAATATVSIGTIALTLIIAL
ncbi:hypothetical protein FDP41_002639 [Naegleria fowleri]|uniref:V-SNARE coiled-coil homology domain-containing protein n=1 Tax=Naegleria fowleri TaxID=5763 RepID=A0A6A5BV30_NAEFO|nr:uncharacterized protein FDP41_002639 [Naegleria fowleri]KAF0978124.1 hypothetical protein FDP41_002639 [Naegleria fowleri]CAG4716338.1 unnamed protein product [Naegleria fowleri]